MWLQRLTIRVIGHLSLEASLAQLAEHALRKRVVVGSIPTGGFANRAAGEHARSMFFRCSCGLMDKAPPPRRRLRVRVPPRVISRACARMRAQSSVARGSQTDHLEYARRFVLQGLGYQSDYTVLPVAFSMRLAMGFWLSVEIYEGSGPAGAPTLMGGDLPFCLCIGRGPVGLMDKASASGVGDSRFESWAGHSRSSLARAS